MDLQDKVKKIQAVVPGADVEIIKELLIECVDEDSVISHLQKKDASTMWKVSKKSGQQQQQSDGRAPYKGHSSRGQHKDASKHGPKPANVRSQSPETPAPAPAPAPAPKAVEPVAPAKPSPWSSLKLAQQEPSSPKGVVSPKAEAPKAEAPKAEAPKPEVPKVEAPKPEAPKAEAPKPEAPKVEAPKQEAPKPEAPKVEVPKVEAPKPTPKPAPKSTTLRLPAKIAGLKPLLKVFGSFGPTPSHPKQAKPSFLIEETQSHHIEAPQSAPQPAEQPQQVPPQAPCMWVPMFIDPKTAATMKEGQQYPPYMIPFPYPMPPQQPMPEGMQIMYPQQPGNILYQPYPAQSK